MNCISPDIEARRQHRKSLFGVVPLLLAVFGGAFTAVFAQTDATGNLSGQLTDAQGAIVPNAFVKIVNAATGDTRLLQSNSVGSYVAPYLLPGEYTVSASTSSLGLKSVSVQTRVLLGKEAVANLTMTASGNSQTLTVNSNDTQLLNTQSADLTTTFSTQEFENLPNPGGDLTTTAFTVPGVVIGTGAGYGNFSSDGLPSLSNLLVVNGMDYNDPYLNQNVTGASILTLGQYEIAQSAVVQNGYSPQYGRQAGVIQSYTTKSGSNLIHGLAFWSYNSTGFNANSFLNGITGTPRPIAVSNQYAAQIGGPVIRNRLFWFIDNEGIRFVEPVNGIVNFPSPAMQSTVLQNLPAQSQSIYSALFKTMDASPAYPTAIPIVNGRGALQDKSGKMGCGSYAGTPVYGQINTYFGTVPASAATSSTAISCMNTAAVNASNQNTEWFLAARVDYNFSDSNKLFIRFTDDQGRQPSYTSLINPVLNQQSIQPVYSGQLNDTEIFTATLTNQFTASGLYLSETFGPANIQQTLAASPADFVEHADGGNNSAVGPGQAGVTGFEWSIRPGGRRDTQYQFVDDLSWLKGKHNLRFGANFKRDDITDIDLQENTYTGYYEFQGLADYAKGVLPGRFNSNYALSFPTVPAAYDALYNIGVYAQDHWQASSSLVLDFGLRVDRTGNPTCSNNCFTRFIGGNFPQDGTSAKTPYDISISTGQSRAFPSTQAVILQPRFGFAWSPRIDNSGTVLRGGFGLFADETGAILIRNEYETFPNLFAPFIYAGQVGTGVGSAMAYAQAGNQALKSAFSSGGSFSQIKASLAAQDIPFSPPSYYLSPHEFYNPEYAEWSLQLEKQLDADDAVFLTYVGNHGFNLIMPNYLPNQGLAGSSYAKAGYSFENVPASSPDPRFAEVSSFSNRAVSNYDGASIEYKHIDRKGLTTEVSYTWSHALDDISNGGTGLLFSLHGITAQLVPGSVSDLMYSNADYDIRHNFMVDAVYVEPFHFQNAAARYAGGGWTVATKAFWRSGLPFAVFNNDAESALSNGTGSDAVLAQQILPHIGHVCKSYSHPCFQEPGIFNGQGVELSGAPNGPGPYPQTIFGNVPRNSFYGPHFADVDLSVYKDLFQREQFRFQIGAQAYNAFNHVNFGAPGNNASLLSTLGVISPGSQLPTPTSPYGKYSGSGSRVVVVQGRLTF
jgi:hypothetical protein